LIGFRHAGFLWFIGAIATGRDASHVTRQEILIRRKGRRMARDQNTYAKRQREMNKKRKAEDKRARRRKRKEQEQFDFAAGPNIVAPAASEQPSVRV
jgi:hypothetical protein